MSLQCVYYSLQRPSVYFLGIIISQFGKYQILLFLNLTGNFSCITPDTTFHMCITKTSTMAFLVYFINTLFFIFHLVNKIIQLDHLKGILLK